MAVKRPTPADLNGVAKLILVARLSQDAVVELFSALGRPLQQLGCAVDRDAFLVAGDQERDRALWLSAALAEMIEHRCDSAGNAALHVDGAAAVELAVRDLAGKRRMLPRLLIARWHHVGMPGDHQIRRGGSDAGIKIFDIVSPWLAKRHAMHREAVFLQ